jgi:hypothetical protein
MPRLHLFELEDQPWLPNSLRDAGTDMLRFGVEFARLYRPIVPRLAAALQASDSTAILDLCSGGGGPIASIRKKLNEVGCHAPITMTDLYSNRTAFAHISRRAGGGVDYINEPVDATAVPEHLRGFRTMFTSFHHFSPENARRILEDTVRQRQGIGVFEITARKLAPLLSSFANIPLTLLTSPFVRPFRWSRMLWTYFAPVMPLILWWDGFVSGLRTYSPDELRALVDSLPPNDYVWQIGRERGMPASVTYLIGYPRAA